LKSKGIDAIIGMDKLSKNKVLSTAPRSLSS
jgi:hypothetical protein